MLHHIMNFEVVTTFNYVNKTSNTCTGTAHQKAQPLAALAGGGTGTLQSISQYAALVALHQERLASVGRAPAQGPVAQRPPSEGQMAPRWQI